MIQAGAYVKEEVCRGFIIMVTNATDLQPYCARALYAAFKENFDQAETSLATVAIWGIGEFGELLQAGQGGPLMEGETWSSVSDADIVSLLEAVLRQPKVDHGVKEYTVTALMKLTARLPAQVRGAAGRLGSGRQQEGAGCEPGIG
jgi:AP-1 complex subunit gamma-1